MCKDIKITKRLLRTHKKRLHEIPILEYELNQMMTTDSGIGNSTILDYQTGYPRPQSVVGFDWEKYKRRKSVLQRKKDKVKAVKDWIDAIEDGQTRCVFRMKYIDDMDWNRIAMKTGYSSSPDYPRLYIRDSYLKKNGIS